MNDEPRALRRILAAVDDTPEAHEVATEAFALARQAHAKVLLFRAISVPPDFPAAAKGPNDALPAFLHREAEQQLGELAKIAPDVACDVLTEESFDAPSAIIQTSDAHDVDLVVIGRHRRDTFDRLMGTNTAQIARRSRRDVLVVPIGAPKESRDCVLACLDDSNAATDVYRSAVTLARACALPLRVFRAVTHESAILTHDALIAEASEDLVARTGSGEVEHTVVFARDLSQVICDAIEKERAAVVVIGLRHRSMLSRFHASTAVKVMRASGVAVLVVHVV